MIKKIFFYNYPKILILNQIITIIFIMGLLKSNFTTSDKIGMFFVVIMQLELILSYFISKIHKHIAIKSGVVMIIIMWHFLLSICEYTYFESMILQSIVLYIYIVFTVNMILYENTKFKIKMDYFFFSYSFLTSLICIFDEKLFYTAYFLLVILMYIYPLLIIVFYKKCITNDFKNMRKYIILFEIYLIIDFIFAYVVEEDFITNYNLENIGWYISIGIIIYLVYIRLINKLLIERLDKFVRLSKFKIISTIFYLTLILVIIKIILELNFRESVCYFLSLILLLTVVYLCVTYRNENSSEASDFKCTLCKIQHLGIMDQINRDEHTKKRIATYLHDEILQNIIAMKNMLYKENLVYFDNEIRNCISRTIETIRDEIDFYSPCITQNMSLSKNYLCMINEILDKHNSSKKVEFICDDNLILFKPYDVLIYRYIKELVNNAAKYSDGKYLKVSISVKNEKIIIEVLSRNEDNIIDENNIYNSTGLKFMKEEVEFLKGNFSIKIIERKTFLVKIEILILGDNCYEYFINR